MKTDLQKSRMEVEKRQVPGVVQNFKRFTIKISKSSKTAKAKYFPENIPKIVIGQNFCFLLTFLMNQIANIRLHIQPPLCDPSDLVICSSALFQFEPISFETLLEVASQLITTTSHQDKIPSWLLSDLVYALQLINALPQGICQCLKHAVVQPHIKKPNLDPRNLSNFRPISKRHFILKIIEKIVLQQLQSHLNENNIFETFQSGFRKYHSTKSALLKVLNDIILTVHSGDHAFLCYQI